MAAGLQRNLAAVHGGPSGFAFAFLALMRCQREGKKLRQMEETKRLYTKPLPGILRV